MKSFPAADSPSIPPTGDISHAVRPSPPLSAPAPFSLLQSDSRLLNVVKSLEPWPLCAICFFSGFLLPLPSSDGSRVSGHRLEGRRGFFPVRFLSLKPSAFWAHWFVPAEPRGQIPFSWNLHQGPRTWLSRNTQPPETSGSISTSAKQEAEDKGRQPGRSEELPAPGLCRAGLSRDGRQLCWTALGRRAGRVHAAPRRRVAHRS